MRFGDIPGHAQLKKQLARSLEEGRVSHALLLHGQEGNAGLPLAMAYAAYLQCTNRQGDDSCGECASCTKAARLIHPDIHYVFPVVKGVKADLEDDLSKKEKEPVSDNFIVSWRSYLAEFPFPSMKTWTRALNVENKQGQIFAAESASLLRKMSLKSFEAEYKVVIIWLPEKMNTTVANKLLKVIEEPPPKTVFLMVAQQTGAMLPTILSRTQLIRVPAFTDQEVAQFLGGMYPDQADKLADLVPLAHGSMVAALNLLHEDEQVTFNRENFIRWMRMSYQYSKYYDDILEWVGMISRAGRENQKVFLSYCLTEIRENYLLHHDLPHLTRMNEAELDFAARFNRFIHSGNIATLSGIFSRAMSHIEMNANPRILFLDMSFELYRALHMKEAS